MVSIDPKPLDKTVPQETTNPALARHRHRVSTVLASAIVTPLQQLETTAEYTSLVTK